MFFYEGLSCPHCHRTFHESDDIVSCPVCGAPHHRGCWGDAGGCACAADHGTDKQWSRDTATRTSAGEQPKDGVACPRCGSMNSPYAEMCATCGSPLNAADWSSKSTNTNGGYTPPYQGSYQNPYQPPYQQPYQPPFQRPSPFGGYNEYAPFHVQSPYGGVSPDNVISGESVRDIAAVVRTNTTYYMPRFEKLDQSGSKISWNWAAFLIPTYWLLHRKQYVTGAIMLVFDLIQAIISQLLYTFYLEPLTAGGADSYYALANALVQNPAARGPLLMMAAFSLVCLMLQIYFGLFGNYLYLRGCTKQIRLAKKRYPEGYHSQLAMVGGTTMILAIVAYFCISFIPSIITMLVLSLK